MRPGSRTGEAHGRPWPAGSTFLQGNTPSPRGADAPRATPGRALPYGGAVSPSHDSPCTGTRCRCRRARPGRTSPSRNPHTPMRRLRAGDVSEPRTRKLLLASLLPPRISLFLLSCSAHCHAIQLDRGHSHANRNALPCLAAGTDALVQRKVVADHGDVLQGLRSIANQASHPLPAR